MPVTDVCRLCLAKEDLVWVFDKRFENSENMKEVIFVTTGVEIHLKDLITQKICQTCCNVTISMYRFRSKALKNNEFLKVCSKNFIKDLDFKIPNTSMKVSIKPEVEKIKLEPPSQPSYSMHPSVKDLVQIHPNIKLPTKCLKSDINPFVSMPMDDVENYFRKRNLNFSEHTKLALQPYKSVAMKKTSTYTQVGSSCTTATKDFAVVVSSGTSQNKNGVKINTVPKEKIAVLSSKRMSHSEKNIPGNYLDSYCSDRGNFVRPALLDENPKLNISDYIPAVKRRKISEHEHSPRKEGNKEALMEVLQLSPKPIRTLNVNQETPPKSILTTVTPVPLNLGSPSSLSYLDKSVPLLICNICNSIHYHAKELKKHKLKHMRCQFCKARFRSIENKTQHLKDACPIKNMMLNLPDVKLEKVELNVKFRHKYEDAFKEFPPLKRKDNIIIHHNSIISSAQDSKEKKNLENYSKTSSETLLKPNHVTEDDEAEDIIEILSDDEDPKISSIPRVIVNSAEISRNSANKKCLVPKNGTSVPSTSLNHNIIKDVVETRVETIQTPENTIYNTVSIVKPDITINNSDVIKFINPKASDVEILKKLLVSYGPLLTKGDQIIQTDLPTISSITTNVAESTTVLKGLKQVMQDYKIPVQIKYGKFMVSYNYNVNPKPPNKLQLWNDLKCIDTKKPKVNNKRKEQLRLPPTANFNHSTGVLSSASQPTSLSSLQSPTSNTPLESFQIVNSMSLIFNQSQNISSVCQTRPSCIKAITATNNSSNVACRSMYVGSTVNSSNPNQNLTFSNQNKLNSSISGVPLNLTTNFRQLKNLSSACLSNPSSTQTMYASSTSAISNNLIRTPLSDSNLQLGPNPIIENPLLNSFLEENQPPSTSVNTTIPSVPNSETPLNTLTSDNTSHSNSFNSNHPITTYLQTPNRSNPTFSAGTSLPGVSTAGNMVPFQIRKTPLNPVPTVISTSDNVNTLHINNGKPGNSVSFPTGLIRVRNFLELT